MNNMDERAQRIRRLSKGIQDKSISDADFIAAAMDARLAKRKLVESSQNEINQQNKPNKKYNFDRDIVDASSKENLQNIPSFNASPFVALGGFVELEHKQKVTQKAQENVKKLRSKAASSPKTIRPSSSSQPAVMEDPEMEIIIPDTEESTEDQPSSSKPEEEQRIPVPSNSSSTAPSTIEQQQTSMLPISKETFSSIQLRKIMFDHLLNIINNGNYDELTSLKGIAKVRAMKIFTKRNAGYVFDCMEDLECIGMNNKNIEKFVIDNLGYMLGKI